MFFTYLRRELVKRRKQTVLVAAGMALAITLVVLVSSLSAGARDAQQSSLDAVYGVGTDITVTQEAVGPDDGEGGGPMAAERFDFGSEEGAGDGGRTSLAESRLSPTPGTATFDSADLEEVRQVDGVEAATATLALSNTSFEGEIPDPGQTGRSDRPDTGGSQAEGGSSFDVNSFSVLGVDAQAPSVGPLSVLDVTDGRPLDQGDGGEQVAVLDADYAAEAELSTGGTLDIGGEEFEVVGLAASTSATSDSAADVYLPLDVAQELAGLDGEVSDLYVQAGSADSIAQVQAGIEDRLPDSVVNTQQDLASTVSGSLATATSLLSSLGIWLSGIVLVTAFLIAALLTGSGVARRTRELGTLKALGWSNARVLRQVAGESLVQSLIGGLLGAGIGVLGVLAVNAAGITLTAGTSETGGAMPGGDGPPQPGGGPMGEMAGGSGATDIVLSAPISPQILLAAIAFAVLGGLLAGAFGGWRASRLRPAEALRAYA